MSARRIWDITQRLDAATPLWPGEPAIVVSRHVEMGEGTPVNVGSVSLPLHAGTHADAPVHYQAQGLSSVDVELEPYIGQCVVLDVTGAGVRVEQGDLDWDRVRGETRVILRTFERFPHDRWVSDFKAIAHDVIARLRDMGVVLIGTDAPSLDPETSKSMDAHAEIAAGDMRILEGLVLDSVPEGRYELIALPLPIAGADASPVRAILRDLA